jgi:hypothetical protein
MLSFWPTETIFINNKTQVMCQSYDSVLDFGDEDIFSSEHLVVNHFQLFLLFFKLYNRVSLSMSQAISFHLLIF